MISRSDNKEIIINFFNFFLSLRSTYFVNYGQRTANIMIRHTDNDRKAREKRKIVIRQLFWQLCSKAAIIFMPGGGKATVGQ